jgi:trigger factor
MAPVQTTTKDLGDSRVRVEAEVGADAVESAIRDAAVQLGRDMKVDGFREGKIPPQVVLQQVGRAAVVDEAVRHALPEWYEEAVRDAGLAPVGNPDLDLDELPDKGSALAFSFEVGVRPTATLGDYKGVDAARRDAEVDDEQIQAEIDRLRESLASLETVQRAAASGDYVVLDFTGSIDGEVFEGGEARGFLLELGSGRLVEGFEEQLEGATADEQRTVAVSFPDDYQAERLAGRDATFAVTVKEVKEKRLPAVDDDLAIEAGGYDSLDELRSEIRNQLSESQAEAIDRDFREAAVDAVAAGATVSVPHDLVHAKAHEMWQITAQRLRQQGLAPEQYLQMTGKTEEELITESEGDAEQALRREATLTAVIEAEGIEVSDDELLDALREASSQPGTPGASDKALRRSLKKARARGTDDALREDIAMRKAVDLIVEHATAVPAEQARPREELWTPDKEGEQQAPQKIWTPGS